MNCPLCDSESIKLEQKEYKENLYQSESNITWNIYIYYCPKCNNIFGNII